MKRIILVLVACVLLLSAAFASFMQVSAKESEISELGTNNILYQNLADSFSYSEFLAKYYTSSSAKDIIEYRIKDTTNCNNLVEYLKEDEWFITAHSAWVLASLIMDPADTLNKSIHYETYYEAVIFNVLNASVTSENAIDWINQGVINNSVEILNFMCEYAETDYYTFLRNKNILISDLTDEEYERFMEFTTNYVNSQNYKMIGTDLSFLSYVISASKDINEYSKRLATYCQLFMLEDEIADFLDIVKTNTDDRYLKKAIDNITPIIRDSLNSMLRTAAYDGIQCVGKAPLKKMVGELWKKSLISLLNGGVLFDGTAIVNGSLLALSVGKNIINIAFSVDQKLDQYELMRALCSFETAMENSIYDLLNNYQNTESYCKLVVAGVSVAYQTYMTDAEIYSNMVRICQKDWSSNLVEDELNRVLEISDRNKQLYQDEYNSLKVVSGYCGDMLGWVITPQNDLIIYGVGTMKGYQATTLPWVSYCNTINNIYLSSYLTSISSFAFKGFTKITSIVLPLELNNIGEYAFSGCASITGTIEVPKSVTTIGYGAFEGTKPEKMIIPFVGKTRTTISAWGHVGYIFGEGIGEDLTTQYYANGMAIYEVQYEIPKTLKEVVVTDATQISYGAFYNCYFINKITLNTGLKTINVCAFRNCTSLEEIIIPNTVTYIGNQAFCGCTSANNKLVLPSGLTTIGNNAFTNCKNLNGDLIIPKGVVTIGEGAFSGCSKIEHITFSAGVENIGNQAFKGCSGISGIVFYDGLLSIGEQAFSGCTGITGTIEMPVSVTTIGYGAFEGTNPLKMIIPFVGKTRTTISAWGNFGYIFGEGENEELILQYYTDYTDGDHLYEVWYGIPKTIKEVVITDATQITYGAFYNCNFINKITLNTGLKTIKNCAFYNCAALEEVKIPNTVTYIGKQAFYGCASASNALVLPSGLTTIGKSAFANCKKLNGNLIIPKGVVTIGEEAFSGCSGIEHLTFSAGVENIGNQAFQGCSGIRGIVFYDGLLSVGEQAFSGCTGITGTIEVPKSVTTIGYGAFEGTKPEKMIIPFVGKTRTTISAWGNFGYIFGEGTGEDLTTQYYANGMNSYAVQYEIPKTLKEVVVTDATQILYGAFYNCRFIEMVTLNTGLKTIYNWSFRNCTSLGEIKIPNTVTYIGTQAFCGCTSANNELVLPSGLTTIGNNAFTNCKNLNGDLIIPKGVVTIGEGAFSGCSKIEHITFSVGVENIGNQAFKGCSGISGIVFYDGLLSIGEQAFSGCTGITGTIEVPVSVTTIGYGAFEGTKPVKMIIPFVGETRTATQAKGHLGNMFGKWISGEIITQYYMNGLVNVYEVQYIIPKTLKEVVVTDATQISYGAFYNCYFIDKITLNTGLKAINSCAFYNCAALEEIKIPNTVTYIGKQAFSGCVGFVGNIEVPKSVTKIEEKAFEGTSPTKLIVPFIGVDRNTYYPEDFYHYDEFAYLCYIFSGTADCQVPISLTEIEVTNAKSISYYAFKGCNNLKKIVLNDGVTEIGTYAFYNCTKLQEVTFHNELLTIGNYAFSRCTSLTDVYYVGTEIQWDEIDIGSGNGYLNKATIHYIPLIPSEEIKFSGSSLTLQDNICIDFKMDRTLVTKVGYRKPYIVIELDGEEYTISKYQIVNGEYVFEFADITSANVNDIVKATLYATFDGTLYQSETLEYSFATYCNDEGHTWRNGTCLVCGEVCEHNYLDDICSICGRVKDVSSKFEGASITLGGNLGVNFGFELSEDAIADENAMVVFTMPDNSKRTVSVKDAVKAENGYYIFTCEITAKEMADVIKAQVVATDYESEVFSYSVIEYAERLLKEAEEGNAEYAEVAPLVKAMLNYGASSQVYFDYCTDNLANNILSEEDRVLEDVNLSTYRPSNSGSEPGIRHHGTSLTLKSETELNVYFVIEDESDIPEFYVNGEVAIPVKVGDYYRIKIEDIAAQNLGTEYVVTVGNLEVKSSAMSYGYAAMYSKDENLKNVAKAMYAYNQAAIDYLSTEN